MELGKGLKHGQIKEEKNKKEKDKEKENTHMR